VEHQKEERATFVRNLAYRSKIEVGQSTGSSIFSACDQDGVDIGSQSWLMYVILVHTYVSTLSGNQQQDIKAAKSNS